MATTDKHAPVPVPSEEGTEPIDTAPAESQAVAQAVASLLEKTLLGLVPTPGPVAKKSTAPVVRVAAYLLAAVTGVFGAGGSYVMYTESVVKDVEMDASIEASVSPVREIAETNRDTLVLVTATQREQTCRGEWEDSIARQESLLDALETEYLEALADYRTSKAAGERVGKKPRRSPAHITQKKALEDTRRTGYNRSCQEEK